MIQRFSIPNTRLSGRLFRTVCKSVLTVNSSKLRGVRRGKLMLVACNWTRMDGRTVFELCWDRRTPYVRIYGFAGGQTRRIQVFRFTDHATMARKLGRLAT